MNHESRKNLLRERSKVLNPLQWKKTSLPSKLVRAPPSAPRRKAGFSSMGMKETERPPKWIQKPDDPSEKVLTPKRREKSRPALMKIAFQLTKGLHLFNEKQAAPPKSSTSFL